MAVGNFFGLQGRGAAAPSLFFLCLALYLSVYAGPKQAEAAEAQRLALVIGNSAYRTAPLRNPSNDGRLMAASLQEAGFDVFTYHDTDRRTLTKAFHGFGQRLREAGKDAVALIYYAGHAAQIRGENYLIPVGAKLEEELDIEIESIRASSLLQILNEAGNALNIVILDACRNNPFIRGSRSVERGLARMDAPTGTLLAYSTAPGQVAVDGTGANSPYTHALARHIQKDGLKVEEIFKKVRIEVMEKTQNEQVPWESSSLIGDFYFRPPAEKEVVVLETQPAQTPAPIDGLTVEVEYWKSIATSNDRSAYQTYLDRFPSGVFADIAKQRIAQIDKDQTRLARERELEQEQRLWESVRDSGDPVLLQSFLKKYPTGFFHELAEAKLASVMAAKNAPAPQVKTQPVAKQDTPPAVLPDPPAPTVPATNTASAQQATQTARLSPEPPQSSQSAKPVSKDFSGKWRMDWEVAGGYEPRGAFCSNGEKGSQEFEVEDGEFSFRIVSNRGGSAYVTGTLSDYGALIGEFRGDRWRAGHRLFATGDKSGIYGGPTGRRCAGKYTLTYLGKID